MIWLPIVGSYADIDAYASIIAYADLLNQRGKPAQTYIPADTPNYSIPESLRLRDRENTAFDLQPDDQVIILDLSIPEVIHRLVPDNRQILELIDHHFGYEEYWQQELGERAIIKPIGAVATSIFEWWGECWDYAKMSPEIAKLLLAAILDNTLNFNAAITTERDHRAAEKLAELAGTTLAEFTEWYFSAVSATVLADIENSMLGDMKATDFAFGQLAIWDAASILANVDKIREIMNRRFEKWIVSVINISERRNYIMASPAEFREYFQDLLGLKTEGEIDISDHLLLRKEILAKMQK